MYWHDKKTTDLQRPVSKTVFIWDWILRFPFYRFYQKSNPTAKQAFFLQAEYFLHLVTLAHMGIGGLVSIDSPLTWILKLSSGHQAWWQALLPTEPSC